MAQLGEQIFLKCLGICFSQPLPLSPIFSATAQCSPTLSTLVFLLLQKFESTLHVRYCCVIRTWSSDFNPVFLSSTVNRLRSSNYTADAYANIYVLGLVYLPLLWWLETQFFNQNWWLKRFRVSKWQISELWTTCF